MTEDWVQGHEFIVTENGNLRYAGHVGGRKGRRNSRQQWETTEMSLLMEPQCLEAGGVQPLSKAREKRQQRTSDTIKKGRREHDKGTQMWRQITDEIKTTDHVTTSMSQVHGGRKKRNTAL